MPHADLHQSMDQWVEDDEGKAGFWGNIRSYAVSLMKAYWGDAATADNDWCFDYLPRLTGDHSTYATVKAQIEGRCKGYFLVGENPAVGSANGKMQRLGMANLDWLVVRDLQMIESATFWKDGPEIETGELVTEEIGTEIFFLPAAAHTEKAGTFTQTQRMLQWRDKAVDPPGDATSELQFYVELGNRIREKLRDSTDEMDRPLLDLAWDYPVDELGEPDGEAVLREINGTGPDGAAVGVHRAEGRTARRPAAAGSTAACTPTRPTRRDAVRPTGSRTWSPPSGAGPGPPTGGSSTTVRPRRRTGRRGASGRSTSGGTPSRGSGSAPTCPTSSPTVLPTTCRSPARRGRTRSAARTPS